MPIPDIAPGRRLTLSDVAGWAGVSRSTASLVIRDRALCRANVCCVQPPNSAIGRTRPLRYCAATGADSSAYYSAPAIRSMPTCSNPSTRSRRHSGTTSSSARSHRPATRARHCASFSEALILLGPTADTMRLTALSRQLPIVMVGRRATGTSVDTVRTADDKGASQAVDHLVGLATARSSASTWADTPAQPNAAAATATPCAAMA